MVEGPTKVAQVWSSQRRFASADHLGCQCRRYRPRAPGYRYRFDRHRRESDSRE